MASKQSRRHRFGILYMVPYHFILSCNTFHFESENTYAYMCNFILLPTPLQPITLVIILADELLLTSANEVSEQYNILQIYNAIAMRILYLVPCHVRSPGVHLRVKS